MKEEEYLKELSRCVRCGSCKAFCPTYDEDVTEGMAARGRLTLLRGLSLGQLTQSPVINDRVFSCILCGACAGLCPPGVDITEALYHGRNILKGSDKKRRYLRLLTKFSIKNPDLSFRLLKMLQHILFPYLTKKGILPFQSQLPDSPLRDEHYIYKAAKKRGRVALFTGCSVNFLYPHLGEALINVLIKSGYEVVLPQGEVCCGMPFRTLGLEEEAIRLAEKNMRVFGKLKVEAILSLCPTCILALKEQYPKLIGDGMDRAMDVSSFFIDKIKSPHGSRLAPHAESVTYHDPCHLNYSLGIKKEPREILKNIGFELIEAEGEGCCGFGGLFSISYKDISRSLLQKRVDAYLRTGADTIVTSCPGCIMQLSSGVKDKKVFHVIELIEEAAC